MEALGSRSFCPLLATLHPAKVPWALSEARPVLGSEPRAEQHDSVLQTTRNKKFKDVFLKQVPKTAGYFHDPPNHKAIAPEN